MDTGDAVRDRIERNEAVLGRFLDAVVAGDLDAVRSTYHPDAVVWHSNDRIEQPASDNLRTLAWMAEHLPGFHYTAVRRTGTADGAVEQHDTVIPIPGRDDPVVMGACLVVTIDDDGRITRLDEYLDSAEVAALTAALADAGSDAG